MSKNGNKDIVELWGHEFSLAKNGLDEAQIVSFVNELISERDLLLQRAEHLSTLTKLAEKTIVEADKLAEDIKKETIDEANTGAEAILAKAEEQSQQMIEEKRTEIITIATGEAEALKANAEREAELLIAQQRERIQPEIRNVAQQLYQELRSQIEGLMQQVKASEVEFEHKLPQPLEQASTEKIEERLLLAPVYVAQENSTLGGISELDLEPTENIPAESQQPNQPVDQANTSETEEKEPLSVDNQDKSTYDKEVDLEILPPLDIKQIMGIMRHLDSLAEVENTELIPLTDRPLIVLSLYKPLLLIELLKTLPEVEEVKEVIGEEISHTEGQRRKIQIALSGNSVLDNTKERLNSNILSS